VVAQELQPALPTQPGDVIDAHVHLFTVGLLQEFLDKDPNPNPRFREAVKKRRFGRRGDELPDMTPEQAACWYVERLQKAGVAKALVVSVAPDSQWTRDFVAAAKGHAAGLCGVKLLPVNRCYRLSDPACRPFFEKATELGANLIIHYGVSVDPGADLRYADPLDLSPVARDFPDLTFVIAHFGAGWFEEVLKLAYARGNVCVDTSGTNNWRDFMPYELTLDDIFRRSIGAIGPERILFGTDSGTTAPYREWIKYQQIRTLEEIGVSAADRDLILRANAVRIFGLDS